MDTVLAAVVVYLGAVLVMVLLAMTARKASVYRIPQADWGKFDMGGLEWLSHFALWFMVGALMFAGLVDIIIWASKSKDPSVSDLIHYHLQSYPWVGWIAAGLVYHLLVDRPAPPWR